MHSSIVRLLAVSRLALLLCHIAFVAHTASTTAACPFAARLGDMGGYNKDILALQLVNQNATHANSTAARWSQPSTCKATEFQAVAAAVLSSLQAEDAKEGAGLEAPTTARAAFHSSATYRAAGGPTALGGPNGGWLQFERESSFPENAGLGDTVSRLKVIREQHPCITFADLVTFVGAIATEFAGGPAIAWIPGRRDALQPSPELVVSVSLPDGAFNAAAIMFYFTNMGLSARDMVAFIGGGHTSGAATVQNSGWNGSFSVLKDKWPPIGSKNQWFTNLVTLDWSPVTVDWSGRLQFIPKGARDLIGENGGPIIRFPSDMAMLQAGGPLTYWTRVYARDEHLFLQDYARVFQRVMQLGAAVPGAEWALAPKQYTWLGINGTATNYGTAITPLNSSYDDTGVYDDTVDGACTQSSSDEAGNVGSTASNAGVVMLGKATALFASVMAVVVM